MRRTVLILGFSVLTSACAGAGHERSPGQPFSPAAERGERFAQRACAGCHVIRGDGPAQGAAPTFQTVRLRYTGPQLERRFAAISEHGHYEMPPIFITSDEARDLAEYIESLGGR